ncbi:MAG: hypothetical protein V1872_13850 [bacterium]
MPKQKLKDFFCSTISEDVKISLKIKLNFKRVFIDELYVQCDQSECQYISDNILPCPLNLTLFAKELEEREEKRKILKNSNT